MPGFYVSAGYIGCVRQKPYLLYYRFTLEGQYSRLYITEGSVFGMEERKVQVLDAPAAAAPGKKQFTQEELQREYDYIRAEKLTRKLLNLGLITIEKFDKIMALNREAFSPALARIMP